MGLSKRFIYIIVAVIAVLVILPKHSHAQGADGSFSIQVSPSPIIDVIKPAQTKTIELKIRNTGVNKEYLKVSLSRFTVNNTTGQVDLKDDSPQDVRDWTTVANPTISIDPGASFTEQLILNPPQNVGFSYSFAVMISRDKEPNSTAGKTQIKGSVAVFTLLTVDRPGVMRKFDITDFSSKKRLYEYLPATFTTILHNSGNTIVQPFGNIFIQRTPDSNTPISVLKFNPNGSYLLPGTNRTFTTDWSTGFPVNKTNSDSSNKTQTVWDWSTAQNFRFGRYYAKLVAVYNDGQHDVPIESVVAFWVIPWKLLLIFTAVVSVLIIGIVSIVRSARRPIRNIRTKNHEKANQKNSSED